MGALALLASWGIYRYTDLLSQVPLSRGLDWLADKAADIVQQPWADGMTGAVIVSAMPAVVVGLLMGLGAFISWPIGVAVVVLCMGPMRLFEHSALGDKVGIDGLQSALSADKYHQLAARDVIGALVWAAILGAPGAVFYRAARELAESPIAALADNADLMRNAGRLFGFLYWLPARVYAVAQLASGSGGRLEGAMDFSVESASSDRLVATACGDQDLALANGPKALLVGVIAICAVVFFV